MTLEQINLIRQSFQKAAGRADVAADVFYNRLFEIKPILRLMFPADLSEQKQKLMKTLALAAASLDRFEELKPALEDLGRKHAIYGVRDEYYPTVGSALLWTLGELLGAEDFNAETEAAWAEMFETVSGVMIRAAREFANEPTEIQFENIQLKGEKAMLPNNRIVKTAVSPTHNLFQVFFIALACLLFANAVNAATYTVTNTNDSGSGSLRTMILIANNSPAADTITFNIPGGGVKTITVNTELPDITQPVTIDGTTQPGYSGAPLIELDGSHIYFNEPTASGLTLREGSTVRALVINRFPWNGISIYKSSTVEGCYIGTNAAGTAANDNGRDGIEINSLTPVGTFTIGGTTANTRNVISGNSGDGISIIADDVLDLSNVVVRGNYIGTDVTGNLKLGNGGQGIWVYGGDVTIGGNTAAARNVISGNDGNGIFLQEKDCIVQGNYIGTNAAGTARIGNGQNGIHIPPSTANYLTIHNIIGGTGGAGNVISGNVDDGILIEGSIPNYPTIVHNNRIGTNAAGTADLGNSENGIRISDDGGVKIGSDVSGTGNLISGNDASGVKIESDGQHVVAKGNTIGTNLAASAALPNGVDGMHILGANNQIGESGVAAARNLISGNTGSGIRLTGANADLNSIHNNLIGTNAFSLALGNTASGVLVEGGATGNVIGGSNSTYGNVIAHNGADGINLIDGAGGRPNAIILFNSIHSNAGLGIDAGTNGVTPNDAGDADDGPNGLQNYPVLAAAHSNRIFGTFNSTPNNPFVLEFFLNPTCDASGHGEGATSLGYRELVTDASGNAAFVITGFNLSGFVGQSITAIAKDQTGDTSEFSNCVTNTPPLGTLQFAAATYTVAEDANSAAITINRSFGSFGAISVDYAVTAGTATAGSDFTAINGTINFANGETSKTFNVAVLNDTADEVIETVNLTLSNSTPGVEFGSPTAAVLNITDNDAPPTLSINDVTQAEGNTGGTTGFTFNVSVSTASGQTVTVAYASSSAGATATVGSDYAPISDTLTFIPGETTKPVVVNVNADLLGELDETFFINLSAPTNAAIADAQGLGTILDDDNPGKFSFSPAPSNAGENTNFATVTVNRINGNAGTVSVDYATSNGTAIAGQDYAATSGTLIFNDGQTSASFTVPITQDNISEADETIFLTLSTPNGGASLGNPSNRTLTILDDDGGLPVNVSIAGTVKYGTTPGGSPLKFVPDVLLTAAGTPQAMATTDSGGAYLLSGLGAGTYTVTPSKPAQTTNNGISLQDASEAAKIAFNQNPNATINQRTAADATGNSTVSLQDASEIAKRAFNISSTNIVGQWKFASASRSYQSISANLTGEDYEAILIGDVTGNWNPSANRMEAETTESEAEENQITKAETAEETGSEAAATAATDEKGAKPIVREWQESNLPTATNQIKDQPSAEAVAGGIAVSLPNASASSGTTVLIPVTVGDVSGQNITSYELTVSFDSTVLQPASPAFDTFNTLTGTAGGYSVFVDPTQPTGRLRVGAFGTNALTGPGTLIFLRFNVLAGGAATSPLEFVEFKFGEDGTPE